MVDMETLVSLCKRRGFIFISSEIYGGTGSVYDYGPVGVLLKNNVKGAWWKSMVQLRDDIDGLDSAILMPEKVWEASGHLASFTDPMVDCRECRRRYRADTLIEDVAPGRLRELHIVEPTMEQIADIIKDLKCPNCGGELTPPRTFNLLMKTELGVTEEGSSVAYLRGETCQGIYVNFKNVEMNGRRKIPFGIAQIGKAFRNEITPGNFTYRTREFEQMEMQYFVKPDEADQHYESWKAARMAWYKDVIGIRPDNLRHRDHEKLAHYAKAAVDIEYNYPFGWKELAGVHNRSDWDLSRHSEYSGKGLDVFDEATKERFIPWIIETSDGADRATLVTLLDAYDEDVVNNEKRVVLRFHPNIAPYKVAVLPLSKKPELSGVAKEIAAELRQHFYTDYDESQAIGKRYRRQDEIGTPFAVTVDFDSLEDKAVTIRERDSMAQERVPIDGLVERLRERLSHPWDPNAARARTVSEPIGA
jgi:glycyl-tRNA synthetase